MVLTTVIFKRISGHYIGDQKSLAANQKSLAANCPFIVIMSSLVAYSEHSYDFLVWFNYRNIAIYDGPTGLKNHSLVIVTYTTCNK